MEEDIARSQFLPPKMMPECKPTFSKRNTYVQHYHSLFFSCPSQSATIVFSNDLYLPGMEFDEMYENVSSKGFFMLDMNICRRVS